ncbi:hypothetical protein ES703_70293 [subsurface metagenome]
MRAKGEILEDLKEHADKLDPQHYELASVAMIETEIQIDMRDMLELRLCQLIDRVAALVEKD